MCSILKSIEKISETNPDKEAIVCKSESLSYRDLYTNINAISKLIREHFDNENNKICFILDRSPAVVVTMISIMETNNCYIPIDLSYPLDRMKYICDNCDAMIVNDNTLHFASKLGYSKKIINISRIDLSDQSNSFVYKRDINKEAYIIYTSGTTGAPKGVMISYFSLLTMTKSAIKRLGVTCDDKVLQYASVGFDAAGWDIYIAILAGCSLYMVDEDARMDPTECYKFIRDNRLTVVTITPSLLAEFPKTRLPDVKHLIVMGEMSNISNMEFWCKEHRIYNGYGPTEATIATTLKEYKIGTPNTNVGTPLSSHSVYILTDDFKETDDVGEIYIGGPCVAIGYYNMKEVTKNKFIEHHKFGRLYRTGDIGRIVVNDVEILGRKDNQVKINGIRIELEDLESHINELDFIKMCAVIYHDQELVCFYVANKHIEQSDILIRSHLTKFVHQTVVPKSYVELTNMPITTNGKIDRQQLKDKIQTSENKVIVDDHDELSTIISEGYKQVTRKSYTGKFSFETNFFSIGGCSLTAHIISNYINKFKYNIKAVDVLKYPTIGLLHKYISDINQNFSSNCVVETTNNALITQQSLFHHQSLNPNCKSYNTKQCFNIKGNLDMKKLKRAIKSTILNHESLKSSFYLDHTLKLKIHDKISDNSDIDHPFSLKEPPIRFSLTNIKDKFYKLIIVKHSIIADIASECIILKEISDRYNGKNIPSNRYSLFEFNSKFNAKLLANKKHSKTFWKDKLYNVEPTQLPINNNQIRHKTREIMHQRSSCQIVRSIDSCLIYDISQNEGSSIFSVLAALLSITLSVCCNTEEVSFGTEVSLRETEYDMNLVSLLVNIVALVINVNSKITFSELLKQVSNTIIEAISHASIPSYSLGKYYKPEIMLVMQDIDQTLCLNGVDIEQIDLAPSESMFPVTWNCRHYKSTGEIKFYIEFNEQYSSEYLNYVVDIFESVLSRVSYTQSIQDLLYDALKTSPSNDVCYTSGSLVSMFDSVKQNCEVRYMDFIFSHEEMIRATNGIANKLIELGVVPGACVAVLLRRSHIAIAVVLAILRTGAHFVPIDPDLPDARINYILSDCNCKLVVTNSNHKHKVKDTLVVDNLVVDDLDDYLDCQFNIDKSTSESIAYIIYTSGSTGTPKGVIVKHKSISNVTQHFNEILNLSPGSNIYHTTTLSFDIAYLELFLPIVFGYNLIIIPHCVVTNPFEFVKWINGDYLIMPDLLQATPTSFSLICDHIQPNQNLNILTGGESLNTNLAEKLLKITNKLYNVYGPSETTIWSTCSLISNYNDINIGHPIKNTICKVFNNNLVPTPKGSTGELYISGIGLSDGYINRPDLTNEKFVNIDGQKFYKTGDIVKRNFDDTMIYINRSDFQCKINGHRIELGEISYILESFPGIDQAVTFANVVNDRTILCSVFKSNDYNISISNVLDFLNCQLPRYMIPSIIKSIKSFPKTANGKININELKEYCGDTSARDNFTNRTLTVPSTNTEYLIYKIWNDVLIVDDVSTDDNIVNIGGTSIDFVSIISKINKETKLSLSVMDIIRHPTIKSLAQHIDRVKN